MIAIKDLTKYYGKKKILDNISFSFDKGVYLITGSNGSGKTTLVKAILGLISYSGTIDVNKNITYVPDKNVINNNVKVRDFFIVYSKYKNFIIDYSCIERFKLDTYLDYKVGELSKGNKQKMMLASAFMEKNDIYIMDEPLNGLDKVNQQIFSEEIKRLKNDNKLIIILSHLLNKYRSLNPYIMNLEKGRLNDNTL